jgi:hypothetical protein
MDLKEIVCENVDSIHQAQERVHLLVPGDNGDEPCGSIKHKEFLGHPRNYWLLEKCSDQSVNEIHDSCCQRITNPDAGFDGDYKPLACSCLAVQAAVEGRA